MPHRVRARRSFAGRYRPSSTCVLRDNGLPRWRAVLPTWGNETRSAEMAGGDAGTQYQALIELLSDAVVLVEHAGRQ